MEDYHTCSGIINEPVNVGMDNAGKSRSGIHDVYLCLPKNIPGHLLLN